MRFMIRGLLLAFFCLQVCQNSRTETTQFYKSLLSPATINFKIFSGYEDIDWYLSPEYASVYYSLWESSTKSLADHSAPVIFYLQGGPGLSSQYAAFRQIGPLQIISKDSSYKAVENPWSWNYFGHLVFVDQPVGTGFSYNQMKDVDTTVLAAKHFSNFFYNFMKNQPWGLKSNPIYLAGEGYAGHFLPAFAAAISQNKSIGIQIEGLILGGGLIDPQRQINTFESFLGSAGITAQSRRNITQDLTNQAVLRHRNDDNAGAMRILENVWGQGASKSFYNGMNLNNYKRFSQDQEGIVYADFLQKNKKTHGVPDNVSFLEYNRHIGSAFTVDTLFKYTHSLEYLLDTGMRVLIYNGQNDFKVTAAGMYSYLQSIEWKHAKEWRQTPKQIWKQAGNVAGWVKSSNNLITVAVKGAGHYVYEDETKAAKSIYLMLSHFLAKRW